MQEDLTVTFTGFNVCKKTLCLQFPVSIEKRKTTTHLKILLSHFRQLGKSLLGSSGGQELGNELSAPYEVPQFPIEQIESKIRR